MCSRMWIFTIIPINSLIVYENNYFKYACLDNCAYKITDKQMIDNLNVNLFKSHEG